MRSSRRASVRIAVDKRELAREIMRCALNKVADLGFAVALIDNNGNRAVLAIHKLAYYSPDLC